MSYIVRVVHEGLDGWYGPKFGFEHTSNRSEARRYKTKRGAETKAAYIRKEWYCGKCSLVEVVEVQS